MADSTDITPAPQQDAAKVATDRAAEERRARIRKMRGCFRRVIPARMTLGPRMPRCITATGIQGGTDRNFVYLN